MKLVRGSLKLGRKGDGRKFGALLLLLLLLSSWHFFILGGARANERFLRVFWLRRENLNPLDSFDLSGRAAMRLAYRGLFDFDDEGLLRCDLAESAQWSGDRLSLTVKLRRDLSFSDGSVLKSEDVAVSVLCWRANMRRSLLETGAVGATTETEPFVFEEDWRLLIERDEGGVPPMNLPESPPDEASGQVVGAQENLRYFETLSARDRPIDILDHIVKILILDDQTLIFHLDAREERLPWHLDCPIVPSARVFDQGMNPVPGIGAYKLVVHGSEVEIWPQGLAAAGVKLRIYPCVDEAAAIQALENEELDLLLLEPENFERMSRRQNLTKIPQQTSLFRYFVVGSDPSRPLNHPLLREAFRDWCRTRPSESLLREASLIPMHRRDFRRRYFPANFQSSANETQLSALKGQTLILAAREGQTERILMDRLIEELSFLDCELSCLFLTDESYGDFAAAGAYDLLLDEINLPAPIDFRSFFFSVGQSWPQLDLPYLFPAVQEDLPPQFWFQWNRGDEMIPQHAYDEALSWIFAFDALPLLGAGFAEQGLIFATPIREPFSSPAYDPYRGLEVLAP